MDPVPTQYVDRDGVALAYQVVGAGPVNVVCFFEIGQHLDLCWTDPDIHHIFERSAGYSTTVYFQRRGFGLSDRIAYTPTLEQCADDVLAIMDAVGMRSATILGVLTTCGPVALAAARAPERADALVLLDPLPQGPDSPSELQGWTDAEASTYFERIRDACENWGSGRCLDVVWGSALATGYNRRLMAFFERSSATPAVAFAYYEWLRGLDIQDVLRSVHAPTRVLHLESAPLPETVARYASELLPAGSFHVLPSAPPGASLGQAWIAVADHLEEVATGAGHPPEADRFLGTVLFTDVVSSTELLARVGDATYRQMRSTHEQRVRLAVETLGGDLVDVAGDGTLSVFKKPSAAVRCAVTISRETAEAGHDVRCGVHTGELERDGSRVTGLTVHIGARVAAMAGPGQVLVSRTLRDLVAGSGLTFADRGHHELKGVPGRWELFAVTDAAEQPEDLPREESMQTTMDKLAVAAARRSPRLVRGGVRLGNALQRRRAGAR